MPKSDKSKRFLSKFSHGYSGANVWEPRSVEFFEGVNETGLPLVVIGCNWL